MRIRNRQPVYEEEVAELSEDERLVVDWRLEQLMGLGFSETEAVMLATCRDVDLGQVRDMIRAGCRRETLPRIVL